MSLTSSLFTGTSGMTNMGNAMQVIGDNVANVNTVGFKGNNYTFADLLSQSVATQSGTAQVGRGMGLGSVSSTFSSGSLESTGNTTDLSIGGDGFFVVREQDSDRNFYTRAGNFNFNKDGYLINPEKYVVQGWKLDSDTGEDIGAVTDILLQSFTSAPKETDHIRVDTNLNADKTSKTSVMSNVWDATAKPPIASSNYEYQTVVKVYDSLGSTHDVTVYYDKKDGSEWEYMIACNPEEDQRNLVQGTTAQGILARGVITFSESSGSIENISMERLTGIIGSIKTTGSTAEEKTHFTIKNYDALQQDCYNVSLQFDGSVWGFNTALRQIYPNAVFIDNTANSVSINLDGDAEGTADLEIKFDEPVQALDTVSFDINNPDGLHIQGVTNTTYSGDAANDNTTLLVHNPEALTDDATFNNVVWNASATTPFWSWGEIHTMANFATPGGIAASNTTFSVSNPAALVDTALPFTLNYAGAGAWTVTGLDPLEYTLDVDPPSGNASSVTLKLTSALGATDITYSFATPLTAAGSFEVTTKQEDKPVGYQTPLIAYGSLVGMTAGDFDNVAIDDPTVLVDAGPFGVTYVQGTGWAFASPNPGVSPSPYEDATTVITAGDGAGMTITLTRPVVPATVPATTVSAQIVYTFDPPLTADAGFSFSTAAYDPTQNAYANATLSGDEKHVLIDIHENDENTTDIEFSFDEPLAKGAGAANSSISFDIKGGTAWQAEETNEQGYYEFMADFLGGKEGGTEQLIEFNIGAKNDGTGQFISDSLTTTQYSRASTTTFQSANGYGAGDLQGVDVSSDGVMTGIYSNGELIPLYRISLAKFLNNQGLFKEGGNLYRETRDSGSPITNKPGTNGLGALSPNSLEMSNVDLANEFVKMIVTQRGFQANSKIVTTVDTLLGEVINMKR